MSQENVEIVRRGIEHLNATGEPLMELIDPDVEWIADSGTAGRVTYRGREGVEKVFEDLHEGLDKVGFDADKLIDAGEHVVALGQMTGIGHSTRIEAKLPVTIIFTVGEDGKIIRYDSFLDAGEALEALKAVGLSEHDAHADS